MQEITSHHGLLPNKDAKTILANYDMLLLAARCGVFTLDAQHCFVAVSATMQQLLGFTAAHLNGMCVLDIVHSSWRAQIEEQLQGGGSLQIAEVPLQTAQGAICWVRLTGLSDDESETLQCMAQDVTVQREYTNELLLRNRAIDATSSGIWIADATLPNLAMTYINPGFETLTGYSVIDVLGENFHLLSGPDTDQAKAEMLETAIAEQRQLSVIMLSYRKNGTSFWNEMSVSPVFDDFGNLTHYIGISQDVSQKIEVLENLHILRQIDDELSDNLKLKYVCDMGLDALLRLSHAQTGSIAMIDDEGQWGVISMVGAYDHEHLEQLLHDGVGTVASACYQRQPMLILDVSQDRNYVPLLKDTVDQIVLPVVSHQRLIGVVTLEAQQADRLDQDRYQFAKLLTGRLAAYLDSARLYQRTQNQLDEITELYKKVQRLEQLKTDMIRIASHDLKNPLSGIMLSMQYFRADFDTMQPDYRDYLENINRAALKMQRIIQGILSLERIEQVADEEGGQVFDLGQLLRKTIDEQRDDIRRKKQKLRQQITPEPLKIFGDPIQLHEALANLLSNANKYTPKSGQITISVRKVEDTAQVRIRDNGYGIPEGQQANLFTPFFRAKSDETDKVEGTGLGLHLVKNIVERHEGEMFFESIYGEGSTFGFNLPLTDKDNWASEVTGSTVVG